MSKRKTHEEFINEMNFIDPKIEIVGKYVDAKTKIDCRCVICNNKWGATPSNLLKQRGCPKCATIIKADKMRKSHETFVSQVGDVNPNVRIVGKYINNCTKIDCECIVCGNNWSAVPTVLLGGGGCPKCAYGMIKKVHDDFVKEMSIINPEIKIMGRYEGSNKKIKCKCLICHNEWEPTPNSLLRKHGCPSCANNSKKRTHQEFVDLLMFINQNIKILGKYIDSKTKVECNCLVCNNTWKATPSNLLKGQGCPSCNIKNRTKTQEKFLKDVESVMPNIKVLGAYINSHEKIKCECTSCGNVWNAIPNNLLLGVGCPHCNSPKGERRIKIFLERNAFVFVQQKKFDDLIGMERPLSYDFYIPDYNILIEYQGQQHYYPVNFFGGERQFCIQQENDNKKRKYAKDKGMKLLEISYKDYNNIESILGNELRCDGLNSIAN